MNTCRMAQKGYKSKNSGKPIYKARQPMATQGPDAGSATGAASATSAPVKSDAPPKGEQVNWQAVMNNAS